MPGDAQSESEKLLIAKRRQRVWHLHVVRKLTIQEIAQALGVATPTISRDLAAVRAQARGLLRKAQKLEESVLDAGAEVQEETMAIARQAWADCMTAPEGSSTRARFLNVVLKALAERIRILQSLGLMEKAPEEVLLGEFDLRRLSDSEAESALAFLRACSAPAGGQTGGDVGGAAEPEALDRGEPADPDQG